MNKTENLKIKEKNIKKISFKELSIVKKIIFWVDILPEGQTNKNAIFARPFDKKKCNSPAINW